MKKNSEYVGVDEKYIPEDEKYVDNTVNKEIKDAINQTFAKDDTDDQNTGRKGLKFLKGVSIGYVIFVGFVILMVVVIFAITIFGFFKFGSKDSDKENDIVNINDLYTKSLRDNFNMYLEVYNGTKYGSAVFNLLDQVVTINKTKKDHIVTIIYNDITTNEPDDIVALKDDIKSKEQYEVLLDYDANGYVYKVTIKNK